MNHITHISLFRHLSTSIAVIGLLFSSSVLAKPHINLHVELNPVGSFVAKSNAIKGDVHKTKKGFKATKIKVKMNSFKTDIKLRDEHLRDNYFKAKKFPFAVMTKVSARKGKFRATLKIKKKKKKVVGTYKKNGKEIEFEFMCNISDFGIDSPSYMGVGVEDEVKVTGSIKIGGKKSSKKKKKKSKS